MTNARSDGIAADREQNMGWTDMKCPTCGTNINAIDLLSRRSANIECKSCGASLRIHGRTLFVVAPLLVFSIFPGILLSLPWFLLVPINAVLVVSIYILSLLLFVRLETTENVKDPKKFRPKRGRRGSAKKVESKTK